MVNVILTGFVVIVATNVAAAMPQKPEVTLKNVCRTKECVHAANRLYQGMDLTADPCDDFNQFACGNFIKNELIPSDSGSLTSFTPTKEAIFNRGRLLLEANNTEDSFESDAKARDYYKSCMDQDERERRGLDPAKKILNDLGGWPVVEGDKWSSKGQAWYDYIYKSNAIGLGLGYIISLSLTADDKNNSYRVLGLDQPDFGLSREYLIKGVDDKDVQSYLRHMVKTAILFGADPARAEREMKEVLEFEYNLAKISAPAEERRDPNVLYNPTTVGAFKALPGYPPSIKEYLNNIFKTGGAGNIKFENDEKLILKNPKYLRALSKLLVEVNDRVMFNYLQWRNVKLTLDVLNKDAKKLGEDFVRDILGIEQSQEVWKTCVENIGFNTESTNTLGAVASSLYVREYFKAEEKAVVERMVAYIRRAFKKMIQDLEWMDKTTKEKAIKKLDNMLQYIAYPKELLEKCEVDELHKGLDIRPDDFLGNGLRLSRFWRTRDYLRFREKIDPESWLEHMIVALVNAFYNPAINSMEFPAGILQGVFFDSKLPDFMNFGSIGSVIGHEITHGFDDQGRTKDYKGTLVDWWSPQTAKEYEERANCIINQYGNFTAKQIGMNVNGINTQGENIADNGGVKESYLAYELFLKEQNELQMYLPGFEEFTPQQMFWINFGQTWCDKYNDGTLRLFMLTDTHSPGGFRTIGSLSNSEQFAKDFKCKKGSFMNPVKKCKVW